MTSYYLLYGDSLTSQGILVALSNNVLNTVAVGSGYLHTNGLGTYTWDIPAGGGGGVPTSRTLTTTAPLTIDGGSSADLSANRTLNLPQSSATTSGWLSSTDWNTFNNKQGALTLPLTPSQGGTGVNNATRTITVNTNNAAFTFNGAYTLTVAGNSSISGTNTGDQDLSGYQLLNTTLTTLSALANAIGWLHNDGAGVLAWSTPGAAGSTTQIQYNNSGSFAGSANLTFDGTAALRIHNPATADATQTSLEVSSNTAVLTLEATYNAGGNGGGISLNGALGFATTTDSDINFYRNSTLYLQLTTSALWVNNTEIDFYNTATTKTGQLIWTVTGTNKNVTIPDYTGTVALGAGTLTVATSNSTTTATHTHAITSSAAPGAAASILATDSSGNIAVQNISTGSTATKWGSGTSFPVSPATNDRFFRTDLGWLCYYDGTRWLTDFEVGFGIASAVYSATTTVVVGPVRTDYAVYVTRIVTEGNTAATNDATHYWTVNVRGANAAYGAASSIDSFDTKTDGTGWVAHEHAPSVTATPTNRHFIDMIVTKTSTAGNLTIAVTVYYRFIVT